MVACDVAICIKSGLRERGRSTSAGERGQHEHISSGQQYEQVHAFFFA